MNLFFGALNAERTLTSLKECKGEPRGSTFDKAFGVRYDILKRNIYTNLHGYSLRLPTKPVQRLFRTHFSNNRMLQLWNELPGSMVTAPRVTAYKNRLDSYHHGRLNINKTHGIKAASKFVTVHR
ncbi:hypothetical protein WA026_001360 [Henosepilachna vigintioctopunctata]|uniref:Uncharacterized protein n=1 Tax=Henosepilachna vigintioctopunctata TaxID=420089 RepID=A0AAW1UT72_9CUCU